MKCESLSAISNQQSAIFCHKLRQGQYFSLFLFTFIFFAILFFNSQAFSQMAPFAFWKNPAQTDPNPFDITNFGGGCGNFSNTVTINGISSPPMTMYVEASFGSEPLKVSVNGGALVSARNATFSISNGQTLQFRASCSSGGTHTVNIRKTDVSGVILDSFAVICAGCCGGCM